MTKTAAYLRLSREDGDKAESDSIVNQRSLIEDYIKNIPDMMLVDEFVDDGYTGTNFDRPAFTKMIEAAKAKKFDCIIVKDLSRLGRNYIETGRYLERIFPLLGIRFISVLDCYDSGKDNGDEQILVSFRNIINDAYCRDISVKIRSSLDTKRKNGEFIGSFAAYGYRKDSSDHNRLVVDPCAAEIVRDIFGMKLEGYNAGRIAAKLNEKNVPAPAVYKRMCGERFNGGFRGSKSPKWTVTTVLRILKNEVYTGTMVQNKSKKISYRMKDRRPVAESDWIRVENTHEAIITRKVFDAVQRSMAMDTRTSPKQDKLCLFSGVLKCAECGENMARRNSCRSKNGEMMHSYVCSSYVRDRSCTSHSIPERVIEPAVMAAIGEQLCIIDEAEEILRNVRLWAEDSIGARMYDRQIVEAAGEERRYLDLKTRLYPDMRDGIISREEYLDMSAKFTEKARAAGQRRDELAAAKAALLEDGRDMKWLEDLKAVRDIEKIDRYTVITLIEKILIHDDKSAEVVFRDREKMADLVALADEYRMEAAV